MHRWYQKEPGYSENLLQCNGFYVEMNEFVTTLIEKHTARETPANHENESVISASLSSACSDDVFSGSPVYVTQTQETDVSSDQDTWSGSDIDSMDEQQLNFMDKKKHCASSAYPCAIKLRSSQSPSVSHSPHFVT